MIIFNEVDFSMFGSAFNFKPESYATKQQEGSLRNQEDLPKRCFSVSC